MNKLDRVKIQWLIITTIYLDRFACRLASLQNIHPAEVGLLSGAGDPLKNIDIVNGENVIQVPQCVRPVKMECARLEY